MKSFNSRVQYGNLNVRATPVALIFLWAVFLSSSSGCVENEAETESPVPTLGTVQTSKPAQRQTAKPEPSLEDPRATQPKPMPATNWPRFRGPGGSGVSNQTGLPLKWNGKNNIVWKTKLPGPGSSSPITWGEHIYVTCYSGYGITKKNPGDAKNLKRHLLCINQKNGNILWDKVQPSKSGVARYVSWIALHGYASSTPAADKDGVYVFFGSSGVAAYSHKGNLKWQVSLGNRIHGFGTAASPIVYRDLVIIHADVEGHALVALDKKTGKEKWRRPTDPKNGRTRSTPVLATINGVPELIYHQEDFKLAAVNALTGKKLWECKHGMKNYLNSSAIVHDGVFYVIGSIPSQALAVRGGGRGDVSGTHKLWDARLGSEMVSPIYHKGYVYWADEGGNANCLNAKTGRTIYRKRLPGVSGRVYASGLLAEGRIYYVSRTNGTHVIKVGTQFKQLAHNIIETDTSVFNASPAVSRGKLLLRSRKYLYCIGK